MSDYKIGNYDIKEVQKIMLEILIEVDRICEKNNIKYILDGGTMLGAVRHGGFIPWDDDLDIAMLREDYEKLIKICENELGEEFFFQHTKSEKLYPLHFGKIRLKNSQYVESCYRDININHGVYIDVFPIDNINKRTKKFQYKYISFIYGLRLKKVGLDISDRKLWKKIMMNALSVLPFNLINNWSEHVMKLNRKYDTSLVNKVCHPGEIRPDCLREMYTDVIYKEFEGYKFPIPKDYERFLRDRYGEYMNLPPTKDRKPSHNIVEIKI